MSSDGFLHVSRVRLPAAWIHADMACLSVFTVGARSTGMVWVRCPLTHVGIWQVSSGRQVYKLPVLLAILEKTGIRQIHRLPALPSLFGFAPGMLLPAHDDRHHPCIIMGSPGVGDI